MNVVPENNIPKKLTYTCEACGKSFEKVTLGLILGIKCPSCGSKECSPGPNFKIK